MKTVAGFLKSLPAAYDALKTPWGRRYTENRSTITSKYTVSWVHWSVMWNGWKGLVCAPLHGTVRHLRLTNHKVPSCKMRLLKDYTDGRWSPISKICRVPHDIESVSPSGPGCRNWSTVYMTLAYIWARSWKQRTVPQRIILQLFLDSMDDDICGQFFNEFFELSAGHSALCIEVRPHCLLALWSPCLCLEYNGMACSCNVLTGMSHLSVEDKVCKGSYTAQWKVLHWGELNRRTRFCNTAGRFWVPWLTFTYFL